VFPLDSFLKSRRRSIYPVKAGAKVNRRNRFGATPLLEATEKGHLVVMKTLVEMGAEINLLLHITIGIFLSDYNPHPRIRPLQSVLINEERKSFPSSPIHVLGTILPPV
jgi:ankyrin repeat protein